MSLSSDPICICGFCRHRMPRSEAVARALGGRDVLYCPKCKGPCRPEDEVSPVSSSVPWPAAPGRDVPPPADPAPSVLPPVVETAPDARQRLGLRRREAEPPSAFGIPSSPRPASPGDPAVATAQAEAAGILSRVQANAEKEERRRAARAPKPRSLWSAFLFPFKALSLLAILLMMAVFSTGEILGDMGAGDGGRGADAEHAFLAAMVEPGGSGGIVERYLEFGPRAPAPGAGAVSSPDEGFGSRGVGLFAGLVALSLSTQIFGVIFLMYFAALLLNIIYETANGIEHFPRWPNPLDIIDSFLLPAWLFLLATVVSFGPALACFILPFVLPAQLAWLWALAPLVFLAGCLYYPMSLLCAAMRAESSAVFPVHVLPALARAHVLYAPVLLAFLLVPAWPFARAWLRQAEVGLTGWRMVLLDHFLQFALLVAGMRALGLLYRRIEHRLGWARFRAI